jgi:5-methylcytosine-specific restriction endonuclease McrA
MSATRAGGGRWSARTPGLARETAPPAPRREALPRELRYAVWERDGGRCVECGSAFELQYDHVIPVALGGATSAENLQLLCGDCNRAKGATLG